MSSIILLPEHIANQIAAGEVVEGPSSIIKELVENSIDAKASKIEIIVSKNLFKIEVADNGEGIALDQLSLAFKKHATSKIKNIDDLSYLSTNGFRGEALPSIAAVSKLTCISKQAKELTAHKIYLENGEEKISQSSGQKGTRIIVDDLFFNVAARFKFLKSDSKEKNKVIDTVRALALANLGVAISLSIDGKLYFQSSGSNDLFKTIVAIFGSKISEQMILLEDIAFVQGIISNRFFSRSDKRGIFTFVNNRFVQCYIIKSAIDAVYKKILGPNKYPIAVINLQIPNDLVDVNVHPTKKELRYQNPNQIYTQVGDAVTKALTENLYKSDFHFQTKIEDQQYEVRPKQVELKLSKISHPKPNIDLDIVKPYVENFEKDLDYESRQFIGRFGATEIEIVNSTQAKEIISQQNNKVIFDLVIQDESINHSVILKGQFLGENWIQLSYLQYLKDLGAKILEKFKLELTNNQAFIQKTKSRPSQKPSKAILEKVWLRDNFTCVYCAKPLLHPDVLANNLTNCLEPKILQEHLASYDHYLPASQFSELNIDIENLYACCQSCNQQKSNSLALKTWQVRRSNSWAEFSEMKPNQIAGLDFTSPRN